MSTDLSVLWGYHRGKADALIDMTDRHCRHLLSFGGVGGLGGGGEKIARVPDATREEIVARYLAMRAISETPDMRAIATEFRVAYCTVVRITRPMRLRKEAA